jgi:hypothetical protein
MKTGRKPRAGKAGKPITLRASPAERARWTAAAKRERLTLSDWLRGAAELRDKASPSKRSR